MVFINVSMRECRDTDRGTKKIEGCLRPGQRLTISEVPISASTETSIKDHLMPTSAFTGLLEMYRLKDFNTLDLSGVYAVTHGLL